jgi:methyl-accepting chemotaxis protein
MRTLGFNVSLRLKIIATGAVGLLGLLILAGIYMIGERSQARFQSTADEATNIKKTSNAIHEALLRARDFEKDFLLNSEEGRIGAHVETVKWILGRIGELQQRMIDIGQPEVAKKVQDVRKGVEYYAEHFAAMAEAKKKLGLTQDSGLEGALRTAVNQVDADLEKFDDERLVAGMHPVRRYEKEYTARRDGRLIFEFKKSLAAFASAVSTASLPSSLKKEMAVKLATYEKNFDEWVRAAQAVDVEAKLSSAEFENVRPLVDDIENAIDNLFTEATAANAASREDTKRLIQIALLVTLALVGALSFLIGQSVSRPIAAMTKAMRELADGHFAVALPGLGRKDEVGEMARAVERFKVLAVENARRDAEEKERHVRESTEQRRTEMSKLANHFEAAVGNVIDSVASASMQLEAAAGSLTETAENTQGLSDTVARASDIASSNVQTVAASAEELASSVAEIARQVEESSKIAAQAVEQAGRTDARVHELSQLASRIGDVVNFITAIAEQTNLLALNATIEAARAGDSGRGFAVVAQEVKALAAQTAKATDEISAQINGMQTATQESVNAIKEIGRTIQRISEIVATIAAAVEQQGAATREIARNVQQAAQGTAQVASSISEVTKGASQTGEASNQVLNSAHSLSEGSKKLHLEVEKFLATVRAA